MVKNGRFKKVLVITLLVILVLSTVVFAADNIYVKKLTATHGRIKFKVGGKDVTKEIESKYSSPAFVVHEYGDRSYVPVRAIADLMGLMIDYDDSTHTAEIIDLKSMQYEKEIEKKDREIAELKKEIETLKKNVVEEEDIKTIEKKINSEYGTYKDVDFDISLKESTNRIDVNISMDLRDGKQESAWNKISYNNRKDMIEDIVDTIAKEFSSVDIYGSVYDEFYRKDVLSFSMRKNGSLNISYNDRTSDVSNRYVDDIVYDEFSRKGIKDAYITKVDTNSNTIYYDIVFSDRYEREWKELTNREIETILDKVSDEVIYHYDYYDYYYDYYDYYYDRDVRAYVYMDNVKQGEYSRRYNERYGIFTD